MHKRTPRTFLVSEFLTLYSIDTRPTAGIFFFAVGAFEDRFVGKTAFQCAACKPKAFPLYVKFSATVRAYKRFLCDFFTLINRINIYAHIKK